MDRPQLAATGLKCAQNLRMDLRKQRVLVSLGNCRVGTRLPQMTESRIGGSGWRLGKACAWAPDTLS